MPRKPIERVASREEGRAAVRIFNWREFDPAMLDGKDDLVVELTA